MSDTKKPRYISVVYEIVNDAAWGELNPLRWEHNGVKAVGVSVGDVMEREHMLVSSLESMGTTEARSALEVNNQLITRQLNGL